MVGVGGLEPPTLRLSGVRSNHLSYTPEDWRAKVGAGRGGGAGRDRTDDLKLAKLPLSQLSYGPDRIMRRRLRRLNAPERFLCCEGI